MAGTRSSHWEQRWLNGEAMVGVKLARSPFSSITQAALTDSGWYAPPGGAFVPPGGLRWGAAAGGAFVRDSCRARPLSAAMQANGWCDAVVSTAQDCTLDKRAVAFCGADSYLEVRRMLPCQDTHEMTRLIHNAQDGCTSWVPYGACKAARA